MAMSSTDRIEKSVLLRAPRARVWRALTDAEEFGRWFGVILAGPLTPGAHADGEDHAQGLRGRALRADGREDGAASGSSPIAGTRTPTIRRWTTPRSPRRS